MEEFEKLFEENNKEKLKLIFLEYNKTYEDKFNKLNKIISLKEKKIKTLNEENKKLSEENIYYKESYSKLKINHTELLNKKPKKISNSFSNNKQLEFTNKWNFLMSENSKLKVEISNLKIKSRNSKILKKNIDFSKLKDEKHKEIYKEIFGKFNEKKYRFKSIDIYSKKELIEEFEELFFSFNNLIRNIESI